MTLVNPYIKNFPVVDQECHLKHDWNRTTVNYFLHFKKTYSNIELDLTTGVQRTNSSNVRLSGDVDEKDQYYYDDFDASLVDQSYNNLGYYSELVLGYRNQLFITIGQRLEENEYFEATMEHI